MAVYEQIRKLRKALSLTQSEFGERIGLTRSAINNHERGMVEVPKDRAKAICAEFGVNMEWLQTGKGEMFSKPADTFIDELAEKYDIDDFLKKAITVYMSLSTSEKAAVKKFILSMNPPPDEIDEIPDDYLSNVPDDEPNAAEQDDEYEEVELNIAARGGNSGTLTGKKKKGESIFDRPDYRGGRR